MFLHSIPGVWLSMVGALKGCTIYTRILTEGTTWWRIRWITFLRIGLPEGNQKQNVRRWRYGRLHRKGPVSCNLCRSKHRSPPYRHSANCSYWQDRSNLHMTIWGYAITSQENQDWWSSHHLPAVLQFTPVLLALDVERHRLAIVACQ